MTKETSGREREREYWERTSGGSARERKVTRGSD